MRMAVVNWRLAVYGHIPILNTKSFLYCNSNTKMFINNIFGSLDVVYLRANDLIRETK
jgi:hypothetical protein